MKLVVSFYGMCLCSLEGRKPSSASSANVVLLNSAASVARSRKTRGAPPLPYHQPLLFVPAAHVDPRKATWSPVPTPESVIDTEGLVKGRHHAWSLSGLELTFGRGKTVTLFQNQQADASGRLPNPRPGDMTAYHDWRRIPDLGRIAPGAKLRSQFTTIGPNVVGLVRFTAGELRGATPKNREGNAAPWQFSPSYAQVVTDRFEFHCELAKPAIVATGFLGSGRQSIPLKAGAKDVVRLVVVHEATPCDRDMADEHERRARGVAAEPELPHYSAFYHALSGRAVAALGAPRRLAGDATGPVPVITTPNCPPGLI